MADPGGNNARPFARLGRQDRTDPDELTLVREIAGKPYERGTKTHRENSRPAGRLPRVARLKDLRTDDFVSFVRRAPTTSAHSFPERYTLHSVVRSDGAGNEPLIGERIPESTVLEYPAITAEVRRRTPTKSPQNKEAASAKQHSHSLLSYANVEGASGSNRAIRAITLMGVSQLSAIRLLSLPI
jgi:hypothetical protein